MPEWVEDLTGRVLLGEKMGIPEKVADTVVILSPPEAGIRVGPMFLLPEDFIRGRRFRERVHPPTFVERLQLRFWLVF
jgi:hypothetical protein